METPDDYEDLWELAEFAVREAYALRSFLEYLRVWPHPLKTKLDRIQNWRKRIGLSLGDPRLQTEAPQRLRDAPPEIRREALRLALADAHRIYFEGSE